MTSDSWHQLFFEEPGKPTIKLGFRVLKRFGHPFLMLPVDRECAMQALSLYSPQTHLARLARYLLRKAVELRLPLPLKQKTLELCPQSPFAKFILGFMHSENSDFPDIALMSGNPHTRGQRYILLVFDLDRKPKYVVKFGMTENSRALIKHEMDILKNLPLNTNGVPVVIGEFHSADADAFATNFAEGNSPAYDEEKIAKILTPWIHDKKTITPSALPRWKQLIATCPDDRLAQDLDRSFGGMTIRPAISHGDFAPWNIKENSKTGVWQVLDWDRGRLLGLPGWDWFHYVIQTGILIEHSDSEVLIDKIRNLFESPFFKDYAYKANIKGREVHLLIGYLLYCKYIIKQSEGLKNVEELLAAFLDDFRLSTAGGFKDLITKTSGPTFSIVTPSYKQIQWLRLCAASVADQKGVGVEHIIQDTGTGPELLEWAATQNKATVFSEQNSGMHDAINCGLRRAEGQVVAWLNCNEQYLPGTLAMVARFFKGNPMVDVLFGDALLIDEEGRILSYSRAVLPTLSQTRVSHLGTLSCATFVRKSALNQGLFLKPEWKDIADVVWIADLLRANLRMAVMNVPMAAFVITKANFSQPSLAHLDNRRWQENVPYLAWAVKLWFVFQSWLRKVLSGTYKLRHMRTRLYTLSSPKDRVECLYRTCAAQPDAARVKLSIITPSFRSGRWLKLCIASVADQEGVEFEHIVQDSCSDDETRDWLPTDTRVKAVIEKDKGMYDAVNRGFSRATGNVLAYINCDEQYLPGALKKVADYFQSHPEVDVLLADTIVVDPEGKYMCERRSLPPQLYHTMVGTTLSFLTSGLFIRRRVLEKYQLYFDTNWRDLGDAEWALRAIHAGVRFGILRDFTSTFTDTGANMNLLPNARRESKAKHDSAPFWMRATSWVWVMHYRLRRLLAGLYFTMPYGYAIYTHDNPDIRRMHYVAKPTFRWLRPKE